MLDFENASNARTRPTDTSRPRPLHRRAHPPRRVRDPCGLDGRTANRTTTATKQTTRGTSVPCTARSTQSLGPHRGRPVPAWRVALVQGARALDPPHGTQGPKRTRPRACQVTVRGCAPLKQNLDPVQRSRHRLGHGSRHPAREQRAQDWSFPLSNVRWSSCSSIRSHRVWPCERNRGHQSEGGYMILCPLCIQGNLGSNSSVFIQKTNHGPGTRPRGNSSVPCSRGHIGRARDSTTQGFRSTTTTTCCDARSVCLVSGRGRWQSA